VRYFAGIWKFTSRPSLTDTPACPKLLKRYMQAVRCSWEEKIADLINELYEKKCNFAVVKLE